MRKHKVLMHPLSHISYCGTSLLKVARCYPSFYLRGLALDKLHAGKLLKQRSDKNKTVWEGSRYAAVAHMVDQEYLGVDKEYGPMRAAPMLRVYLNKLFVNETEETGDAPHKILAMNIHHEFEHVADGRAVDRYPADKVPPIYAFGQERGRRKAFFNDWRIMNKNVGGLPYLQDMNRQEQENFEQEMLRESERWDSLQETEKDEVRKKMLYGFANAYGRTDPPEDRASIVERLMGGYRQFLLRAQKEPPLAAKIMAIQNELGRATNAVMGPDSPYWALLARAQETDDYTALRRFLEDHEQGAGMEMP